MFDLFLLKFNFDERDTPASSISESTEEKEEIREEEVFRCSRCGNEVTSKGEEISVDSAHEHTFVNPGGYVFRIGCFRQAPGCIQAGESTSEFSWFKRYAWRYAICGNCLVHLGWAYHSSAGSSFFGLILDRLVSG